MMMVMMAVVVGMMVIVDDDMKTAKTCLGLSYLRDVDSLCRGHSR